MISCLPIAIELAKQGDEFFYYSRDYSRHYTEGNKPWLSDSNHPLKEGYSGNPSPPTGVPSICSA